MILIILRKGLTQHLYNNGLVLLNDCVCPGEEVTFECTVCGVGLATIWTGSLFNYCANDVIIFRHSLFDHGLAIGACNGAVVARSIGVSESDVNGSYCYSSQLNVIINSVMNNKTVTCLHVDAISETVIDTLTINITTGACDIMHRWRKEILFGGGGSGEG